MLSSPEDLKLEATFVPADPPRDGWLALWQSQGPVDDADTEVELVLPAGGRVRRRRVPARRVSITAAIDSLCELPAGAQVSSTVRAWSTAARVAVDLVARGRLLPGRTASGFDAWDLGPLDLTDTERLGRLADALPPAAHAVALSGTGPLRVTSPVTAIAAFTRAIADSLPRTAAAPGLAGHRAFAAWAPSLVGSSVEWLDAVMDVDGDSGLVLRLEPPYDAVRSFRAVPAIQSHRDHSLMVDAGELWTAPPSVLSRLGDAETTLLLGLRRGARVWPPLAPLLDQALPEGLGLADSEVAELLGEASIRLASAGIQVLWPTNLFAPIEVRPVVSTPTPASVVGAGLTLESLAELSWRASLDGEQLTEEELAELVEAKRPLVRLRGRWVLADPDRLALLRRRRRRVTAGEALSAALGARLVVDGETVEVVVEGPIAELAHRLRNRSGEQERPEPEGLAASLRPYQRRGLAWLREMAELGLGGVLADDMGLGKTIQMLALHLEWPGPTLVVCPSSVLANWEREAHRFAPGVPVRRYHGPDRSLDRVGESELVVATYAVARLDAERLANVGWGLVVADEAQAIKNPLARTSRALRAIPAGTRFALTGTPVENRLSDLWAMLDWTSPGLLGPLDRFRREIAIPVERHRDPDATSAFAGLVRPFVLRRRKSDPSVVPELPPKTETDELVLITAEQATLYRAVTAEMLDRVAGTEGINRRGLVLKLLTALKQICNHPAHYLGQPGPLDRRSGKLEAVTELAEAIRDEEDAVLVFTQYVTMARLLARHFTDRGFRTLVLHGSVPLPQRQKLVDSFQAGEADVFVISLKAGGTGLNLTRATHVVHYDRWWNPAVEDQASDRAWRIGQDRPVQVHRLICEGTVEERVAGLLEQKRKLADAVVGGGEGWITELDDTELARLVALGRVP